MITTVDLSRVLQVKPLLSDVLIKGIQKSLDEKKQAYLYLNQRGASHCEICGDCGHITRCEDCDHVMRVHTEPKECLKCHLCEREAPRSETCSACGGTNMRAYGARIQSVYSDLMKLFPKAKVEKYEGTLDDTNDISSDTDIVLGTRGSIFVPDADLGLAAVLLVEAEISVPGYDVEEAMYTTLRYVSSRSSEVILQTYSPDLAIVQDLSSGNFRGFFSRTLKERKDFHYPPFAQMATIWIEHANQEKVKTLSDHIYRKIGQPEDTKVSYDPHSGFRIGRMHRQPIIIRGDDISDALSLVDTEILKNRGVWLERHS